MLGHRTAVKHWGVVPGSIDRFIQICRNSFCERIKERIKETSSCVLCPWTNNMTQSVETRRAIKLNIFCFLFLLRLAIRIFNFIRELSIFCKVIIICYFHMIRINRWNRAFKQLREDIFSSIQTIMSFQQGSHGQIDGYLLIQSLSRIVKYQFDVSCVINPRDRHIEGWIHNRYTLWTKLSRASHIYGMRLQYRNYILTPAG